MYVFEVNPDEEVIEKVQGELARLSIKKGAVVSVIGAVKSCSISNMDPNDAKTDIINTYDEPLEISGTGEITDGVVHIHCTASRKNEESLAGHLHRAVVGDWFVRVYVVAV